MCELQSQLPLQESSLILSFCTCSQIPSLRPTRIVPQLMERGSWGKLWLAIINQPAMKPSRYSKHQGSVGWQLRNPLLLVFFLVALLYCTPEVLHLIVVDLTCKARAVIDYIADTETGHSGVLLWNYGSGHTGLSGSWRSSAGAACHRDLGWAAARLPAQLTFAIINTSRQIWQQLLVIQNRSHWRGETD